MAEPRSVLGYVPAASQPEQQPRKEEDRSDGEPEGQDVRLGAGWVGRTDPTCTTNQEQPGRPEAYEATRNRRPARALGKEPPPDEQTWEQREWVDQVGKPKQPAKRETYRQGFPRLHLSGLRLANVGPSMLAGTRWVNASTGQHYGEMVVGLPTGREQPLVARW
jgi:hypothetical protein